jgi:tetratricopeptide (TPR) repeat protein
MNILKKLFSKNPADLLARGDRLLGERHFYEARCAFEDAQRLILGANGTHAGDDLLSACEKRIKCANHALAELNIGEAEFALGRGLHDKALEHLELAKSLTDDAELREKAEGLAALCRENDDEVSETVSAGGCASCSSCAPEDRVTDESSDVTMPLMEYYDLLIQQLPREMYEHYTNLGEEFAAMYVAASANRHDDALRLLEEWYTGSSHDIYCYEKGMILFRLGMADAAEVCLRDAIGANGSNSLAHLGLALMLVEGKRLREAAQQLDSMMSAGILAEQSRLLRADVHLLAGDTGQAIDMYSGLLNTSTVRIAAERLHEVLVQCGRSNDAEYIVKRYLGGCCH